MCGILGVLDFDNNIDKSNLKYMRDILEHRGPDDKGIFIHNNIGLAHRRLSIIDISKAGHQPMCNEDGSIWITYNGEIYNFEEIRQDLEKKGHEFKSNTDTEVIIHSYEEYGPKCLSLFNGMFAFGIWDSNKKQLFLARDRIGIKPLYYSKLIGAFIFSSEIKAILAFPNFKRKINQKILRSFIRFSYYLDEYSTLFENVFCLEPGHYIIYDKSGFKKYRYWDVDYIKSSKSKKSLIRELKESLEKSVKMMMISDVPIGAFLSGGLDSSTIVALMSKYSEYVKTFSVGFDNYNDELPMARFVSKYFNTDHTEISISADKYYNELGKLVWYHDDPITHKAAIPLYFLSKKTKNKATVILSGEGSDELFAGYDRYKKLYSLNRLSKIGYKLYPLIQNLIKKDITHNFIIKKYLDYISKKNFKYIPGCEIFPSFSHNELFTNKVGKDISTNSIAKYYSKSKYLLNNNLYADLKTYLISLLMKQDKMSMAASIESRVPYLDHKIVEFAAKLPINLKLHNFTNKYILKKSVKKVLPKKIIYQKKRGFPVPTNNWWRKELKNIPEDLLLSKESICKKYFKQNKIRNIIYSHQKGINNFDEQLNFMLNFEIWNRIFIDNFFDKAPSIDKII